MATVRKRVQEHYHEALKHFPEHRVVGLFLQGSQNYLLDTENSDVDTKLIVVPSFEEIALNKQPVSTTHVRENDEHIDFKDVRLMIQTFKKQNINFLEVLFTDFYVMNPLYAKEWQRLVDNREKIARYNEYLAIKAMMGTAYSKFNGLTHGTPARQEVFDKFGYDPKQLHHLLRIEEFMERYLNGTSFKDCLVSENRKYLIDVKKGLYTTHAARMEAADAITHVEYMSNMFSKDSEKNHSNEEVEKLFQDVQKNIMKIALQEEFKEG